jgi:glucose-specific phosphotransferase system IIA component
MFHKKEKMILFPADGTPVSLKEVPDEVFSSGMLGIGAAVLPQNGTVYAPVSGNVISVSDARHAYSIVSEDGVELMVHIGIDTVTLGGRGFVPMVAEGDAVRAGDALARVDLNILKDEKLPLHIVVLITNPESVSDFSMRTGKGLGGKSELAVYQTTDQKKE